MILPVRYLWQQLNGPQTTGVCKAIEEYWKTIFDTKLDYFNKLSIETANDDHLTLFGLLSGLVRPTISEPDRDYFYFTENPETNVLHGFSDLADLTVGGKFSKLDSGGGIHNVSVDTEFYRALLRAWTEGEGEIGSLMLLDDICAELTKLDIGEEVTPFYQFSFMAGDDIPQDRAPGDVFIDMRSMAAWHNPLHVYAILNGIGNSAYAPQPRLFVSLGASGRVATPIVTPEAGTYDEPITVTITVTNPVDATIYYTLDGTDPTRGSTLYEGPFTISESCILRTFAVANSYGDSTITRKLYTIG
jgi:hypothetical protein